MLQARPLNITGRKTDRIKRWKRKEKNGKMQLHQRNKWALLTSLLALHFRWHIMAIYTRDLDKGGRRSTCKSHVQRLSENTRNVKNGPVLRPGPMYLCP